MSPQPSFVRQTRPITESLLGKALCPNLYFGPALKLGESVSEERRGTSSICYLPGGRLGAVLSKFECTEVKAVAGAGQAFKHPQEKKGKGKGK